MSDTVQALNPARHDLRHTADGLPVGSGPCYPSALINPVATGAAVSSIASSPHLAQVRALEPTITALADEAEAGRKLPEALVRAFIDARLFQMYVPGELGGDEIDYVQSLLVLEELARADGSAGWNVMIGAGNGRYAALMAPETANEVFADPRAVWAAAFPPGGRLVEAPGGYRLSGRWPYCSGCQQSDWFFAGCLVSEGDHARRNADGRPLIVVAVLPRSDWQVIETWNTTGMRGTGSHDIVVDNAFIPPDRTFSLLAPPRIATPLYRIPPFSVLGPGVAAVCLGIARHALDGFVELAQGKRHAVSNVLARERVVAQMRLSEAEATLRAARSFFYETAASAWAAACEDRTLSLEERALLRIASVNAAQASTRAVDLVFSVSGSSAIQASAPIERCWRDIHTAATHVTVAEANYEATGRVLLGLDPGPTLL
jgi:alkylation response protein AidB-like acyl-CoA dehydrogenase